MIDESTLHSDSPTLRLADGEVIHCGPENALLRHTVNNLSQSLENQSELDAIWMPLVLYGEPLCGKSLVGHSLANVWKQQFPKKTTVVMTAADLARAMKRTELSDDIDRLTRRLRAASLLVIDDVQQLAGKTNVENWLAGLLDYRTRHQLPVIVTSNVKLANSKLSGRLRSRLSAGLSICISLPYAATRKDVIIKSARTFDLALVDDDIDQLVEITSGKPISGIQSVVASVATNRDSMVANANRASIEVEEFDDALIQKLIRTTARRFGVKVADLRGPSRRKNTVLARAVAMFMIREITSLSLAEIGQHFRNRDHTTVRHACEKMKTQFVHDETIREAVSSICNTLDIRLPSSWIDLLDEKCA